MIEGEKFLGQMALVGILERVFFSYVKIYIGTLQTALDYDQFVNAGYNHFF